MEKRKRSLAIDILNGPMWDKILRYALPVAATGILGQLFNASDIAIVGNFAEGDTVAAVAAVGANGPVIGLLLNIFIGIALGANVVIANAIGRGDKETVYIDCSRRIGRHYCRPARATACRACAVNASGAGGCFSPCA